MITVVLLIGLVSGSSHFILGQEYTRKTYNFSYDTGDELKLAADGPRLMRQESRLPDGTVLGRYGYTDPFGVFRQVEYVAGPDGYYAYEDVGGKSSSSIPLFFKATARQKGIVDAGALFSSFTPPLYHPEAHEAASDPRPSYRESEAPLERRRTVKRPAVSRTERLDDLKSAASDDQKDSFPVISLPTNGPRLEDIVKLLPSHLPDNSRDLHHFLRSLATQAQVNRPMTTDLKSPFAFPLMVDNTSAVDTVKSVNGTNLTAGESIRAADFQPKGKASR